MRLYVHRDHKDYKGRYGLLDLHTAPRLCGCYEFSAALRPQRPLRTIRDRETKTAISIFTQLLSSEAATSSVQLYVHRDHKDY